MGYPGAEADSGGERVDVVLRWFRAVAARRLELQGRFSTSTTDSSSASSSVSIGLHTPGGETAAEAAAVEGDGQAVAEAEAGAVAVEHASQDPFPGTPRWPRSGSRHAIPSFYPPSRLFPSHPAQCRHCYSLPAQAGLGAEAC